MWESMQAGQLRLQRCRACRQLRYPPAPLCPHCLGEEADWSEIRRTGTIVSWVVFHREYFSDFPAPHRCVTVRLDDGPLIVTTLHADATPPDGWIGKRVTLEIAKHLDRMQHRATIIEQR
jgi:uncharacterized OB-fold protein